MSSLLMKATRLFVRLTSRSFADTEGFIAGLRARQHAQPAPIPARLRRRYVIEEEQVRGHAVVHLRPREPRSPWHIVYTCGGAYVSPASVFHWLMVDRILQATGAKVTVALYPLAPEHSHDQAFAFVREVYRQRLDTLPASRLILAGDSAGGGLALSTVLQLRDAGEPLPGRVILFAPWLDISLADPAARALESRDPELTVDSLRACGALWAGGADPRHPYLSPLYGAGGDLPPIDIYQGSDDVLLADVRSFVARTRAAGGAVQYTEVADAFHVFNGAVWTAEARDVYRHIGATLAKHFPAHAGRRAAEGVQLLDRGP